MKFNAAALLLLLASTAGAQDTPSLPADVVVKRGDATVDLGLVDAQLARVPADKRAGYMNDPERIELLLQGMLVNLQLAAAAEKAGLADDPLIVNELKLARAELLARKMLARHMGALKEPDFEQLARERYLSSPETYQTPETRDLRHLVVLYRNHGVDGARTKAEQLAAQFKAEGGDFEAFAKAHSEEPGTDKDGGLLNAVGKGDVDADFYDAAFALKAPGDVSGATRSRFGYHLIQLVKVNPASRKSFEEVKPSIVEGLKREFLTRSRAEFVDNVKAEAPLEANPDLVVSLRSRYLPDGAGAATLQAADQSAAHATEQPAAAPAAAARQQEQ